MIFFGNDHAIVIFPFWNAHSWISCFSPQTSFSFHETFLFRKNSRCVFCLRLVSWLKMKIIRDTDALFFLLFLLLNYILKSATFAFEILCIVIRYIALSIPGLEYHMFSWRSIHSDNGNWHKLFIPMMKFLLQTRVSNGFFFQVVCCLRLIWCHFKFFHVLFLSICESVSFSNLIVQSCHLYDENKWR